MFVFLLFGFQTKAQNYNVSNERTFERLFAIQKDTAVSFHSGIQPYSANELNQIVNYDSLLSELDVKSSSKFVQRVMNKNLVGISSEKGSFSINPVVNTGFMYEKGEFESKSLHEAAFGINIKSSLGKKWSGELTFLSDHSIYPSYVDGVVQSKNISPGYGYSKDDQAFFVQGNVTFTADKVFTLQAGYGTNFIGDGYRSLLLSDNTNSYPYLKVTANIWKIKYMALYTMYQDIRNSRGNPNDYFNKYSTTHYLSYNVSKWLNIGFFESIIFQAQEGNFYRGYEFSYLNPVIFLRPVEFALGSADNALLGGSVKIRVKKKNIFYSQVIFDEFLLDELKAGNGWWGNKYGIQGGVKMYDFIGVKNLKLQLEYNIVRPFTYSYYYTPTNISTLQNYGHFNAALAHPLGANFKESIAQLTYHKKRWVLETLVSYAEVGLDTSDVTTIGQDIYKPYNDREQNYGYFVGSGNNTKVLNSTLKISYVLNPQSRLTLYGGVSNRTVKDQFANVSDNFFFIGLRTNIINRYFDF